MRKLILLTFLASIALGVQSAPLPKMAVFYLQFSQTNEEDLMVRDTLQELELRLSKYQLAVVPKNREDLLEAFDKNKDGFFISSSGEFWKLHSQGAWRMATLTGPSAPLPNETAAGAYVVRKDSPFREVEDLKGKKAAVTNKEAFLNSQIALSEIAERGFDPDTFFSSVSEVGRPMRKVLESVKEGRNDVALVRAGLMESLIKDKDPVTENLRVLPPAGKDSLQYAHSTKAYPGWTFFAGPSVNPIEARDLLSALLSLPPSKINGGQWLIGADYSSVDNIFKNLKTGPYEYLRHWGLKRIWDEYSTWILFLLMLLAFGVFHSWRNAFLVKKRTAQLREALETQRTLTNKIRSVKERMEDMQKVSIVGLFSSMAAHDLLQPLTASSYLLTAIKDRIKNPDAGTAEKVSPLIGRLEKTIGRSVEMIRRVRSYAKRPPLQEISIPVRQKLEEISADLLSTNTIGKKPDFEQVPADAVIFFDPFDFEVILTNLIKKAWEAQEHTDKEKSIRIYFEEDPKKSVLTISNPGPKVTKEEVRKFSEPLSSNKPKGLGLGLSIVKLLMQNHGDTLQIEPLEEGGIKVILTFFKKPSLPQGTKVDPKSEASAGAGN